MSRRATAAAAGLACILLVGAGRASAADPGVEFSDQKALTPSQGDLDKGVTGSVCNTTVGRVTVSIRLAGFEFTTPNGDGSATPVTDAEVLAVDFPTQDIEPGQCEDFVLKAPSDAVSLADPSYEGSVLALSNGAGSDRLALTVPGTSKAAKPDTALGDVELHGSFNGWWDIRGTANAREGMTLRFEGDNPPPSIKADSELGVLARGSDSVQLVAAGDSRIVHGVLEVAAKITGARSNGTYVGQLDPNVAGSDDKPISVKMIVADQWLWAAVLCLAGLIAGILAKVAAGRWRVLAQWKYLRGGLEGKYDDADTKLATDHPDVAARFKRPSSQDVSKRAVELNARTTVYRKYTFLFDTARMSYKAVADHYATVGDDIRRLRSETDDGLGASITALDERIETFLETFNRNFPTTEPPTIIGTAKGVAGYVGTTMPRANRVDAKELPVGGAAKSVTDAVAAVAMLDNWEKLATRFRRCRRWAFLLRVAASAEPALDALDERIVELHLELFESVTNDDLTIAEVDNDLGRVYRRLAVLAGRYGVYLPSNWEEDDRATERLPEGQASSVYITGPASLTLDAVRGLIEAIPPAEAVTQPEKSERWTPMDTAAALVLEVLIGLGAALTLFIAVQNLYVDKPFGSAGDYFAVFALGIGAELVISWFVQAVNSWRAPVELVSQTT